VSLPRAGVRTGSPATTVEIARICQAPSRVSDLISVRLDDNARRALAELEATGLSRSEAVRRGLVAAAQRLRDRQRLIDEVAELAIDEADRAEAAEVAAIMEDLRAPW
jgi:Arc/MetJ-type ribon-helix-helix transcriptional regulator